LCGWDYRVREDDYREGLSREAGDQISL